MNKVKLFIAASLDGKIARPDGSVAWLEEYPNPDGEDYGYGNFLAGVGTVVMGRKTYEEILGFGVAWPYPDAKTFVVTTNKTYSTSTPQTGLLTEINAANINDLTSKAGGDVWLVGGGEIISAFLSEGLVDEMTLTVIPRILGDGIPLFPKGCPETHLELKSAAPFPSGFVNLIYSRKKS